MPIIINLAVSYYSSHNHKHIGKYHSALDLNIAIRYHSTVNYQHSSEQPVEISGSILEKISGETKNG